MWPGSRLYSFPLQSASRRPQASQEGLPAESTRGTRRAETSGATAQQYAQGTEAARQVNDRSTRRYAHPHACSQLTCGGSSSDRNLQEVSRSDGSKCSGGISWNSADSRLIQLHADGGSGMRRCVLRHGDEWARGRDLHFLRPNRSNFRLLDLVNRSSDFKPNSCIR